MFVRFASLIALAIVVGALSARTGPLHAQDSLYYSMAVDLAADGHYGDVQSGRSLTEGSFDVEFEIDGDFGPTGLGTFAFDLDYPQELVMPSGEFQVNAGWSESGGGQTVCFLLKTDIGDGVARLACNLAESTQGATQPGVMATLQFSVVPGAAGCGEMKFVGPDAAIANGGNSYELRETRGGSIAVNRSDCPGVLDATPPPVVTPPAETPQADVTPGSPASHVIGPDDLTATAAADAGHPLDTPVPGASPSASSSAVSAQTAAAGATHGAGTASAASGTETAKSVIGPVELTATAAADVAAATAKPGGGSGSNRFLWIGIALVGVALLAGLATAGYSYSKRR